ncbi:MAG: ATP-binding cassette domain-containing protein [Acidimicrobiia bacterium]|nr:ATP-binding cassette domain-containing protein [Acidimicrobiia bacterium]
MVPLRVNHEQRTYVFTQPEVTIGREAGVDVVIDVPDVSRVHGIVRWIHDEWHFTDNSSRNGSFLAGSRVNEVVIDGSLTVNLAGRTGPEVTFSPAIDLATEVTATTSRLVGDIGVVSAVHDTRRDSTTLGRAPDNDIVVDDLEVSRHHAEMRTSTEGQLEIVDLGSHNGTYVNGVQVERATLNDFDLVTVGHHMFRVLDGVLEEFVDAGAVQFEAIGLGVELPGGFRILDQVSFTLPERSLVAVLGPSGSGKTTLLRALTGFSPATEGQVIYGGRDMYASYADVRQRIGYVPQDDILHNELTVRQALRYAARLRFPPDVPAEDIAERVDQVINELGLAHRADVAISSLSGGQRKRASVGFELLTKPSLLFLDEPTSGLDPGYERALTQLLRELADGGRSIVVVTHSVQSLDLCDRVVMLAPGGRLAYFGPPDEALRYLGCDSFAEAYVLLADPDGPDWHQNYQASPAHRTYVELPNAGTRVEEAEAPEAAAPVRQRGWFRQYRTLTRRYASVIWQDRKLTTLLALQAPLLALLMLIAMGEGRLAPRTGPGLSTASLVLAVLVLAATWLGMSNSGREIAKETAIYRRERAIGLSTSAYVASKVTVLAFITLLQTTVLVVVGLARQGVSSQAALIEPGMLELVLGVGLSGIAAVSLGLLISALAKTPDRAMSLLPVVLIVQLVVAGGFKDMAEKPLLREISYVATAQWGFSAAASTVDLNDLQLPNDCLAEVTRIDDETGIEDRAASLARCALSDAALMQAMQTVIARSQEPLPIEADCVTQLEGLDAATVEGMSSAEIDEALLCTAAHPEAATAAVADETALETLAARAGPVNDNHPFRFWDQTPRHWLINMTLLGLLTAFGLVGTWWVLRRRDPESS